MAKDRRAFTCKYCGASHSKWSGQCSQCDEWNCIEEAEALASGPTSASLGGAPGKILTLQDLTGDRRTEQRRTTGIKELDRSLGGSLVAASATLAGGDPGIGESTLLLQAAGRLAVNGASVIYFLGEESTLKIQMQASRLRISEAPVKLAAATSLRDFRTTMDTERS